jgi:hypothetical protein
MDAVDPHFERVYPLFDENSTDVVQMAAQVYSKESGQTVVVIDEELSV